LRRKATVLFLYGITLGEDGGATSLVTGGAALGVILGVAAGFTIYWGLVSIPTDRVANTLTPHFPRRESVGKSEVRPRALKVRERFAGYD
jgi:hypothetical protein